MSNKNFILSIGNIVIDKQNNKKHRVVAIVNEEVTLCEMETNKLLLSSIYIETLLQFISNKEMYIENDEKKIIDIEKVPEKIREKFKTRKEIMLKVMKAYAPSFIELSGHQKKDFIENLLKEYNMPRNSFWRVCTAYFQSGFQDSALIDGRYFGNLTGKTLTRNVSITDDGLADHFVIDEEIRVFFDEALKDYKLGRCKTITDAFNKMNLLHFMETIIKNGVPTIVLKPPSQRPTYRQFAYYINKHLSKQEIDLIKTSALEQKNNKRLIVSDSLYGVNGPGDMVEIDACEVDISLVSVIDPSKTVGRPIVYFMIDVYSRVILAMSVAFDNNSMLGLTNLFLNLADDKQKYCEKYGITYENKDIWPSNIIPNQVRVDKGAEFRSKGFERICDELGIKRNIVLPGCGSLKGVVEQSFRQLHLKQNHHLEGHGLIQKRHDSKHHETAMLNIEEYTKMVIGFVLIHNQQCLTNYPLTKDMILKKVQPVPALLWKYGVNNGFAPRPIPSKEQYLFNLMTPITAKVSRKGISYKDLWYLNTEDKLLAREMFNAQNKKESFEARMDMRDVGAIYYIRDNKLMIAKLNPLIHGNAEYEGLTMKQYEDYRKGKKEILANGKINNEELSAFQYAMNNTIVEEATKTMLPDSKNMRPAREIEKQAKSKSNKISNRLEGPKIEAPKVEDILVDELLEEIIKETPNKAPTENKKDEKKLNTYSSWEEALEDW